MAFGPKLCASCGSSAGIEEHHLYLKSEGCPDDLTVWLCHVCHGRAHSMTRRMNMGLAIKSGLEKAKIKGIKPGQQKILSMQSIELIFKLKENGESLRCICDKLYDQGIKNPSNGKKLCVETVRKVLMFKSSINYPVGRVLHHAPPL